MKKMTDEEVEAEIARLKKSPFVELSRREEAIRNQRRQYMYTLRWHERNGKRLYDLGWSADMAEEE